jgi:ABC-type histidine transport system ATPase subunit
MSEKDDITRKLRKMMPMWATPEHGLIVVRWHYISTMEEWRNDVDLCADAANEIERLRTQLEMWQDGNIMADSHSEEIERLRDRLMRGGNLFKEEK